MPIKLAPLPYPYDALEPHIESCASRRQRRIDRMGALLADQQAIVRVARNYGAQSNGDPEETVAHAARHAVAAAVMLRHHLARLGADVREYRRTVEARESAMCQALEHRLLHRSSHPQLFNRFQRRLTSRFWHELIRDEDQALTATLDILSARWRRTDKELQANASHAE